MLLYVEQDVLQYGLSVVVAVHEPLSYRCP